MRDFEKHISNFLSLAERDEWSDKMIVSQLKLFLDGKRGVELHDNTCSTLVIDDDRLPVEAWAEWEEAPKNKTPKSLLFAMFR